MSALGEMEFCPDIVHTVKCIRNSGFNNFLTVDGSAVGMRDILMRYFDEDEAVRRAVRGAVSLDALRNKNRFL
jgi:hypothetical protein